MSEPVFVIVGHVNRGKSSIVSTLAADDSVTIAASPGTTTQNRSFPMRVAGRTLYTLVDTPGFERARRVREWLKEHSASTTDRRRTVERFMAAHEGTGEFPQECQLLRPIMDGGAILYVVDGSVPLSPQYEAEMEVLSWTTQPRMALINRIRSDDYSDDWRAMLDPYFSLVREFDAHAAGFVHRVRLLQALRELREEWRGPLDEAISLLVEDRRRRARESALAIAEMLVDMLTLVEEDRFAADVDPEPRKPALAERYKDRLRDREREARAQLLEIYEHHRLEVRDTGVEVVDADLFDTATWSRLGLTRGQLDAAATAAGALAGGAADAMVGGASFGVGAAIGAAVGFGTSRLGWRRLARVRLLGQPMGGRLLRLGPMTDVRFPWIVLDRALLHHEVISNRAHARREPIDLAVQQPPVGRVAKLSADKRRKLERLFKRLRRLPSPEAAAQIRQQIAQELESMVEEMPQAK